jgi:hypothetical protein
MAEVIAGLRPPGAPYRPRSYRLAYSLAARCGGEWPKMSPRPSVWWAHELEEATLYRVTLDNGDELPVVTLVDLPALVTELGRRIRR